MEVFKLVVDIVAIVANVLTMASSAIVIYLFLTKRRELSTAMRALLNYSFQTTLSELRAKLESLNDYNVNDTDERTEIKSILHEIAGQIRGNKTLNSAAPDLAANMETLANSGKKLTEPKKRAMVAEIRELLRYLQIDSIENPGEKP